jgi:acetyl-CoA acetyltransferase
VSVAAEEWDCILVVGAEKMYQAERGRVVRALMGAMDVESLDVEVLPTDRSPFIDVYAGRARRLMTGSGVTAFGLASVAAKAWLNGSRNPKAQRVTPMSVEEILAARVVVEPLRMPMCSLIGDGAAAAVVVTGRSGGGGVRARGSQLRTLATGSGGVSATMAASGAAYEEASIAPVEVGFAEVHDATAVGEGTSWVDLGLCEPGEEGRVRDDDACGRPDRGQRLATSHDQDDVRREDPVCFLRHDNGLESQQLSSLSSHFSIF